ncbi:MAG: TIGR04014 family B12-binding domain/radical SAM domain-containing protein [Candidatus Verstraetearchaeota archaeon]|nr:TIGR04014 family B12-binding domain/radical SAM domain-containing protein [Candidatus Verstraetearchaeota archaeon]
MKIAVVTPEVYTYGAMLVAGSLEEAGHEVKLIKVADLRSPPVDELRNYPMVCLGLYSTLHIAKLAPLIRQLAKAGCYTVVGGPAAFEPRVVFYHIPEVDAVVVGEAEDSIAALANLFSKASPKPPPKDLEGIPGVFFVEGDEVAGTPPKPVDLDKRPPPKIPPDIYRENIRGANVYMEILRGCHGNCTFCQVHCMFGRVIRCRALEDVVAEAREFSRMGASRIAISGGTVTYYRCSGYSFTDLLHSLSSLVGPDNLSTPDVRVDAVDDEVLEAIKRYTIGWIFYGIESGSQRMLNKMRKGITLQQIKNAVEMARELGVKVAGSFIVGYLGESDEDYEETKQLVEELSLHDCFVSIAEPLPRTPYLEEVLKSPLSENPVFVKDQGLYGRKYGLTVAEARAFDLMITGFISKPRLELLSRDVELSFLQEAKRQGEDIRKATLMLRQALTQLSL